MDDAVGSRDSRGSRGPRGSREADDRVNDLLTRMHDSANTAIRDCVRARAFAWLLESVQQADFSADKPETDSAVGELIELSKHTSAKVRELVAFGIFWACADGWEQKVLEVLDRLAADADEQVREAAKGTIQELGLR